MGTWEVVLGKGIHFHGKFALESNFSHFMELRFTSFLCGEFPFMLNLRNFNNFALNYAEIDKFFTRNHDK